MRHTEINETSLFIVGWLFSLIGEIGFRREKGKCVHAHIHNTVACGDQCLNAQRESSVLRVLLWSVVQLQVLGT